MTHNQRIVLEAWREAQEYKCTVYVYKTKAEDGHTYFSRLKPQHNTGVHLFTLVPGQYEPFTLAWNAPHEVMG